MLSCRVRIIALSFAISKSPSKFRDFRRNRDRISRGNRIFCSKNKARANSWAPWNSLLSNRDDIYARLSARSFSSSRLYIAIKIADIM